MKKFITLVLFFSYFISCYGYSKSGPVIVVIGTRPEAVKLIPLYQALKNGNINALLCSTGQHERLLSEIYPIFGVQPDYDFNIMKSNQDLFYITRSILKKAKEFFTKTAPSLVIVQGDTTTAMAAALAAFYLKIPVAHVEAGLRTRNLYAPYPEELNRQLIGRLAAMHFAPTKESVDNLISEHIDPHTIFLTGNTVVDALNIVKEKLEKGAIKPSLEIDRLVHQIKEKHKRIIVLTAHRRESFDGGLMNIFCGLKQILEVHPEAVLIYPMHPNPIIKETYEASGLGSLPNMIALPSLGYQDMVHLLISSDIVATDSGGIQEEAVTLNKPTLILRNETDRPEGITIGIAKLVGTSQSTIISILDEFLNSSAEDKHIDSPYGDGKVCQRIFEHIKSFLADKDNS